MTCTCLAGTIRPKRPWRLETAPWPSRGEIVAENKGAKLGALYLIGFSFFFFVCRKRFYVLSRILYDIFHRFSTFDYEDCNITRRVQGRNEPARIRRGEFSASSNESLQFQLAFSRKLSV